MAKLKDLEFSNQIKCLVFGDSGAGKTCFACGFPGPIYVADFDGKVSSAAKFYSSDPERVEQIDYDHYGPNEAMPGKSAQDFYAKLKLFHDQAKNGDLNYATIVLDSLTTFNDEAMARVMRTNPGIKRNPPATPALQDYGILRLEMKKMINYLLSLPVNVVVTAHIEVKKDETTGGVLHLPMLTGKLATELPIYFGEVYRAYVDTDKQGNRKHLAQTQSDRKFSCRSQLGVAPTIELKYESLINQGQEPKN